MPSDKIIEEKPNEKKDSKKQKEEEDKKFQKAIDETDIAIFKRYDRHFIPRAVDSKLTLYPEAEH